MQQVAGHLGAEVGQHAVNGHARPEFQPGLKYPTERAAEAARSYGQKPPHVVGRGLTRSGPGWFWPRFGPEAQMHARHAEQGSPPPRAALSSSQSRQERSHRPMRSRTHGQKGP